MSNDPLWFPTDSFRQHSNLSKYQQWLERSKQLKFDSYEDLWKWSVSDIEDFWESLLDYFSVDFEGRYDSVLQGKMPKTRWFEGISLNYSEHIFKMSNPEYPAIIFKNESDDLVEISWEMLYSKTAKLAGHMTELGVESGDCVVGYLPTTPEASVAFLASNSLGAVWSSCSPDFGTQSVIDRFRQIRPKVLICTDQYSYGGKVFNRRQQLLEIIEGLPSLEHIILISSDNTPAVKVHCVKWEEVMNNNTTRISFRRVPFNHPIWVLYSSGTTGLPKAMTHSHGGILLEHFKYLSFHNNVKPGDRCFWYTTTGWMMWNYIQASWLCGGTVVLYDGSPAYPSLDTLWQLAADTGINHFGVSAGYVIANMKGNTSPGERFDLSAMISLGSTGSPLPPEAFEWLYGNVSKDLWITSISGGSDVCSAFVGGNPLLPVYRGEIQCRALGCKLAAFDDHGKSLVGQVGEMVIREPMPSMPIYFWDDQNFERYQDSYFTHYEGVWRHGDWTEITSNGGVIIYGRSDSTLNRGGVRIGTSEIYRAIDDIPQIRDSLVVAVELANGEFYMPLFVMVDKNSRLDEDLKNQIKSTIRTAYSPRHVPDEIIEAPDIPYTISGKKVETPIKKILLGKSTAESLNRGSLRNPDSLDFFISFADEKMNWS